MRTILRCNLALILLVLVLALGRGSPGEAQPRPTGKKGAAGTSVESDVVYGHKAGLALTFDVDGPHNPSGRATVLFMNSGGFESGKFRQCRETGDGSWVLVPAESLLLQPEGFHYPRSCSSGSKISSRTVAQFSTSATGAARASP